MEALLGLNGAGGIGGGCCCQCEHCRCRQPDETPCPGCRPVNPTPNFESSASVQTPKPADVSGALELLNVALKKIRRRESLTNSRNENFFHPGEILWGSGVPSGRMGHSHGYAGSNSASLF